VKRLAAVLVLTFTLAGCGEKPAGEGQPKRVRTIYSEPGQTRPDFWHGTVDGIECVVVRGTGSGISCDWQGRVDR
jgi:hypothetical protein